MDRSDQADYTGVELSLYRWALTTIRQRPT